MTRTLCISSLVLAGLVVESVVPGSETVTIKPEALLRKAAERTVGALWERIGITLDAFTPGERANYFAPAG